MNNLLNMKVKSKKSRRQLKGDVVSDKMDKSLVVEIKKLRAHSLYRKRYYVSKRLKVHDSENKGKEGDVVIIEQCRPMSSGKHWRLKSIV